MLSLTHIIHLLGLFLYFSKFLCGGMSIKEVHSMSVGIDKLPPTSAISHPK